MEHLYAVKSFITLAIGRVMLTVTKDATSLPHCGSNESNKMFYCTYLEVPISKDFLTSGGCFLRISHGASENKNRFFFNPINRSLAIEKLFFHPLPFNICCGKWHVFTGVFHRDKPRVRTPAKMFPHLKLIYFIISVYGPHSYF